jgi:hypothetical protein
MGGRDARTCRINIQQTPRGKEEGPHRRGRAQVAPSSFLVAGGQQLDVKTRSAWPAFHIGQGKSPDLCRGFKHREGPGDHSRRPWTLCPNRSPAKASRAPSILQLRHQRPSIILKVTVQTARREWVRGKRLSPAVLGADALDLGEMQSRSGVVASGDVAKSREGCSTFGQNSPGSSASRRGSVGGPESPDFLGDRRSGLGTMTATNPSPMWRKRTPVRSALSVLGG